MGSHESLDALSRAVDASSLSESAADRIRAWLTQSPYAEYRAELTDRIRRQAWQELDELFAVEIPFGTAGRRGRMAPLGTNAINARTIGETVQALATYVRQRGDCPRLTTAVAYDTRHRSREFAELAAGILAASGFHVFFFDGIRATPQLSTTVRHLDCACGVVISASHNPPTDNAIKVFWRGGAQLRPPHDAAIFALMQELGEIEAIPFADAVAAGNVEFCQEAMDAF
ncbi:MAG: phospho-sugar mutase, partial [Planctomycetota bacterium]